ncbi:MAG: class I SAM-dependent methyltransferase [Candidatus Rokubacteria bacterium]|nr:class I SAM-dependent methyltransferase [Candidatus Rokubacteria bacterium]
MRRLSSTAFDHGAERQYYSESRTISDGRFGYLDAYYRSFLGEYHRYFDGKRVLDLGAGECLHGRMVCAATAPRLYVNLDLIAARLGPAMSRGQPAPVRFVVGDAFELPFAAGAFDVVWGSGVLFRFRPLERAAAEISRVLAPAGIYLGIEPNFANPAVLLRFLLMTSGDRNDGRLRHHVLRAALSAGGLGPQLRFFWARAPWLRHPILSPTLGVIGQKGSGVV